MSNKIAENNIGVVVIDPWVSATEVAENDNVAMGAAISAVRRVADATDCAIKLVHHTRKSNGAEADVDSVRGASSMIGAARTARVFNRVSAEEAMKLGVKEAESIGIFRVDDAKNNLALPSTKATYRRMVGQKLPSGEYVGVATTFALPDLFDGVTVRHAYAVQREIAAADSDNKPMRANAQATDWAGRAVARVLDLDLDKRAEKARCKAIMAKWIDTNVLAVSTWLDDRRREKTVIVCGEIITREEAGI